MEFGTEILGLRFLVGDLNLMKPYSGEYNLPLILTSYALAALGGYLGLTVSRQIPFSRSRIERSAWLACGALAMGIGVWTMHFIGMAAYTLPLEVTYDRNVTAISAVPSIVASAVTLHILARPVHRLHHIAIGGLSLGAGIGLMHFTGMEAMRGQMSMGYAPVSFAVSIAVAVVLACAAFAIKTRIEKLNITSNLNRSDMIGGLVIGTAVTGMHYTAMSAVTFYEGSLCAQITGPVIRHDFLLHDMRMEALILVAAFIPMAVYAYRSATKMALLNEVFDSSAEGILVVDRRGLIRRFNPAAQAMFGFTQSEVVGKSISTLMPPDLREQHSKHIADIRTGGNASIMSSNREVLAQRKDGAQFPIEINISEVSTGRETLFSATFRDITERRQMEIMQIEALEATEQRLNQQQKLNESQRQFVAMASHEFKTPLAVIDMTAQRLLRHANSPDPEKSRYGLEKIRGSVSHMIHLIESILAAARLEAGKIKVDIRDCDVGTVVQDSYERHRELAKDHEFVCAMEDMPEVIQADEAALQQILTNLLSNAAKYSPAGTRISVVGQRDRDDVLIRVCDEGPGIDQNELPELFTRFYRASSSTGIPGSGIGLHLTKELVEMHGGNITVASKIDAGTVFTIRLPISGPRHDNRPIAIPA